jgi:hypothetical protein
VKKIEEKKPRSLSQDDDYFMGGAIAVTLVLFIILFLMVTGNL